MNLMLKAESEKFVKEQVATKRYQDESAVVEEALRALQERELEDAEKLEALRQSLKEASEQIERGEYFEGKDVTVEMIRNLAIQRLGQPAKRNAG